MTLHVPASPANLRVLLADVKTAQVPERDRPASAKLQTRPFVTLSREPGAGALPLAQKLVERLNLIDPPDEPGEQPWTAWDREVLEKVADDHHLSAEVLDALEESTQSWLADFFSGMSASGPTVPDRDAVFRKVANTVSALAQMGRAIIVGYGGVLLGKRLPSGVHVRLVAPLDFRIQRMAEFMRSSTEKAAARISELERNRAAFFKRYWPREPLRADHFTLTINTAAIDTDLAAELIARVVKARG
jgi:hypothetical protein